MSQLFHDLHQQGTFLMVNAHDAGSALIAEAAGAVAIGTTSGGLAYTLGRRDAAGAVSRNEALANAAAICDAVDIPVSIDAENGWGHDPADVADAITAMAEVGAAGGSIEDWSGDPDIGFYDHALAVARIEAAVETARSLPRPFVICARAEAYLHGVADPLATAIGRLQAFAEAGADLLYAPGPRDRDTLANIAAEAGGPTNALIGVGSDLTMADAAEIGVRRVSVGGSLFRAAMGELHRTVQQMVTTGSFAVDKPPLPGDAIEDLMAE